MDNYSVKTIASVHERKANDIFDRVDSDWLGYQNNDNAAFVKVPKDIYHHGPILPTRFNFNPTMDK